MKLKSLLTTAATVLLAACNGYEADMQHENADGDRDNRLTEVLIGIPAAITRTAVEDNGSARWTEGDTFALWAAKSDGQGAGRPLFALENQAFAMWHYNADYSQAFFTSTMQPLPDGTYDYYAVSPLPQRCDGTTAVYTLPQQQNGASTLKDDIMVAEPATAGALAEGRNRIDLAFRHMMHVIKVTIPQDGNLLQRDLTGIEITFPTAVVGTVSVDITDPEAQPVLTDGSNTVTVLFDEPKRAGDTFWLTIFPAKIEGEVSYRALAGGFKSKSNSFGMNKQCKAGHITPVSLKIPRLDATTRIVFSIGDNFLGEEIDSFKVVDESGKQYFSFNRNADNIYEYVTEDEMNAAPEYSGKVLTVEFDSPHAIVRQQFVMPEVTPYTETVVAPLRVPYILEEDFSQAASGENRDEYVSSDQNVTGQLLDNYMPTNGWSAARYKISGGNAIRINYRFESVSSLINGRYGGRLDTPALTALKPGAKIKVQFDAGAYVASNTYDEDLTTPKAYLQCTVHTGSGAQNGSTSTSISNSVYTSPYFANEYTDDSFDSTFPTYEFTVDNCSSGSRIAWWPRSTRTSGSGIGNSIFYIYIDNIKISIAR